jgi:hypothetical protein
MLVLKNFVDLFECLNFKLYRSIYTCAIESDCVVCLLNAVNGIFGTMVIYQIFYSTIIFAYPFIATWVLNCLCVFKNLLTSVWSRAVFNKYVDVDKLQVFWDSIYFINWKLRSLKIIWNVNIKLILGIGIAFGNSVIFISMPVYLIIWSYLK